MPRPGRIAARSSIRSAKPRRSGPSSSHRAGCRERVYVSEPYIWICAGTGNDNIILLNNHGEDLAIDAGPGDDEVDNRMDFEIDPSPGPIFADGGSGDD